MSLVCRWVTAELSGLRSGHLMSHVQCVCVYVGGRSSQGEVWTQTHGGQCCDSSSADGVMGPQELGGAWN